MEAWKAFRMDKEGKLRFLFRTHNKSSVVPLNQWLIAKKKWVNEGTRKKYRAGFHFFKDCEGWDKFNNLTKNKYIVLPVEVEDTRKKPNSSVKAWLAQKLFVGVTYND